MDVAIFTLRHNEREEKQADARTSSRREHGLKRNHRKLELLPLRRVRTLKSRAKTAEARVTADASAALVDSLQSKVNAWSADAAARRQLREDAVIDARTWRHEDKEERKTAAKAAEKWRTDVLSAMDAQGDRMMKSLVQLLQPPSATTRAADVPGAAHGTHK